MKYLALITQKKTSIAIITGIFVILSLLISLLHPLEYSASNRLMIIQPTNITLDAYSATKSVERVSEKLSQVVYTTSFFDKVMSSDFNIDAGYFKMDERKKRKQWQEMVQTSVARGSGMMHVTVYHTNKAQAAQLISAITHVFNKYGWEYIGSMNIQISEVDSALISKWPVRPRFFLNAFLGVIIGLLVSLGYVIMSDKGYKTQDIVNKIKAFAKTFDGSVDDLGKSELQDDSYVAKQADESLAVNQEKSQNLDTKEVELPVDDFHEDIDVFANLASADAVQATDRYEPQLVNPQESVNLGDSQKTYNIDEEIPKLREIEIDRF